MKKKKPTKKGTICTNGGHIKMRHLNITSSRLLNIQTNKLTTRTKGLKIVEYRNQKTVSFISNLTPAKKRKKYEKRLQ